MAERGRLVCSSNGTLAFNRKNRPSSHRCCKISQRLCFIENHYPSTTWDISSVASPFSFPHELSGGQSFLSRSTIYRLEPLDDNPTLSTCSSKGWLVKVEEYEPGRVRLLNPLSSLRIRFLPDSFPKVINLLDFRVVEVGKAYKLQHSSGMNIAGVDKLLLFPNSAWASCVEYKLIFGLFHEGKLGYVKYGDKTWTFVDDNNFYCDDITVYKGQPYVVDRLGTVSWIDSSMNLIQFSPPLCALGNQKHLVESCGELYVVDRFFDRYRACPKTVNFEVYKLDQEWGRWIMVKNLGDQVFILGNDCSFSVSATEFPECKGNCIYFTDEKNIGAFYLENQKIDKILDYKAQCHPFWPAHLGSAQTLHLNVEFKLVFTWSLSL